MKYSKIAGFIKHSCQLTIWDTPSEQWISDGQAAYPLFSSPKMDEQQMLHRLELPEDKISVRRGSPPEAVDLSNNTDDEELIGKTGPVILYRGELCRTYYTSMGALAVPDRYIQVVEKDESRGEMMLYLRIFLNTPYIALHKGMYLYGIVLACPIYKDPALENAFAELSRNLGVARTNFGGVK